MTQPPYGPGDPRSSYPGLQFEAQHEPDWTFGMSPIIDELTTGLVELVGEEQSPRPTIITLRAYETRLTTAGANAAQQAWLPPGAYVGQRKVLSLVALGTAGDSVVIPGGIVQTFVPAGSQPGAVASTLTLDAVGEYALLEWSGVPGVWSIIYSTGTVTPVLQ